MLAFPGTTQAVMVIFVVGMVWPTSGYTLPFNKSDSLFCVQRIVCNSAIIIDKIMQLVLNDREFPYL